MNGWFRLRSQRAMARSPRTSRRPRGVNNESGFTLIELIIVIVILPMIVAGVAAAIIATLQNQSTEFNRLSGSADAQIASAYFASDVQSASALTLTTSPSQICGGLDPHPGWRPLITMRLPEQLSSRIVSDAVLTTGPFPTITSAQASFTPGDVNSTVTDPSIYGGDAVLNATIGTPSGNTAPLSAPPSSAVSGDRVVISNTKIFYVTYWEEPLVPAAGGAATNYDLIRELCNFGAAGPVKVPVNPLTTLAHDLPVNQALASVSCNSMVIVCTPQYLSSTSSPFGWVGCPKLFCSTADLSTAGVTNVSISASEPHSRYQFNLSAEPRYSNPTNMGTPSGGNPLPSVLLFASGPGTLNVTSANTAVNVSGSMAFNCVGLPVGGQCDGSLVDLDAVNATLSDAGPGQGFQVANCSSPCSVINTNGMSGASYTTSASAPPTASATAASSPWVPAPVGGAMQSGCTMVTSKTFTCSPGEYSNELVLSTFGATYTFLPGSYTFDNGLSVPKNNDKIVMGPGGVGGVFFYIAGGQFSIADQSAAGNGNPITTTFNLTPPTSGAYAGISVYQVPDDVSPIVLWAPSSGTPPVIGGAVEAPGAAVLINTNVKSVSLGFVVAQSLSVSSVSLAGTPSPCTATQLCTVNVTGSL